MNEEFYHTLRQYRAGTLPPDATARLEAWMDSLDSTPEKEPPAWGDAAQAQLFARIRTEITYTPHKPVPMRVHVWLAAAIVLLAIVYYTTLQPTVIPMPTVERSATHTLEKTILPDGTLVWLKKNSLLTYAEPADTRERRVTLRGEGFFEVAKDAERPFIITCGEVAVTVVGTSFNLQANADSVDLKLLTGTVHLTTVANPGGMRVQPNERVVYTTGAGIKKYVLQPRQAEQVTRDTEYNMRFVNASFAEVVARLEQKFAVVITVSPPEINHCHVNLDITDHSLPGSLQLIASILHVDYELNPPNVLISGSGCKPYPAPR